MELSEIAKIQHYVPQFLLKNFTVGKKPQVWVFDKLTDKIFKSHVKNIASENGFYDFAFKGNQYTIEPSLSDIEAHASKIIKEIVRNNTIRHLIDKDMEFLSHFFALQFVRTKQFRQLFKDLSETLGDTLRASGEDISQIKDYVEVDESEVELHGIRSVLKSSEYAPHFLNKSWVLFRTTKGHPFYISDNPITLQNLEDHGPYGNIGLAVQGIEIYFPLSKSLVLGMFCKTHEEEVRKTYKQYKLLKRRASDDQLNSAGDIPYIAQIMDGFDNNATVPYKIESVVNHNSLQVFLFIKIRVFK